MAWVIQVIILKNQCCQIYFVKISTFFCQSDFTWNEFKKILEVQKEPFWQFSMLRIFILMNFCIFGPKIYQNQKSGPEKTVIWFHTKSEWQKNSEFYTLCWQHWNKLNLLNSVKNSCTFFLLYSLVSRVAISSVPWLLFSRIDFKKYCLFRRMIHLYNEKSPQIKVDYYFDIIKYFTVKLLKLTEVSTNKS